MTSPAVPAATESPIGNAPEREQAFREIRVMLRYALAKGKEFDQNSRSSISFLEGATPVAADFDALMTAHSALSRIVAPATPCSLEATEPVPGLLGFLRRPPLIKWMIICALVAAAGFIFTNQLIAAEVEETGWQRWQQWNVCFAAALGAAFYGLFTAHEYVKARTFDPGYNSVYLIRFVLGVVAGLILGNIGPALPGLSDNTTLSSLGPAVIALLGGFSAEAAYKILQRVVDILLAAIRGDNADAVRMKLSQTVQQELLSLASDPALPPATRDRIHTLIGKIRQ